MSTSTLLKVENLEVSFTVPLGYLTNTQLQAVRGVSFDLAAGEILGIVGESGCGKSTLARAVLRLVEARSGTVYWEGEDFLAMPDEKLRETRADMQIIFQDPISALSPRLTVGEIIAEPLRIFYPELDKPQRRQRVLELMGQVGLLPQMLERYPHEFSGGQAQRIGIARALAAKPNMLVCDEPVSALDVSVQAQILNLLAELREKNNLAMLFISHDLSVVRHISDRVMVLYLGQAVEIAPKEELFANPRHPYTKALLEAAPSLDLNHEVTKHHYLSGELPSPINPPSGCAFRTRCPHATQQCAETAPQSEEVADGHQVACIHWRDLSGPANNK